MSVLLSIEENGRIEAKRNSGRVLWEFDVDPEPLPHDYPVDEQLAKGVESFFEYLLPFLNVEGFEPSDA